MVHILKGISLLLILGFLHNQVQAQHPCASWRRGQARLQPVISAKTAATQLDYDISFYHLDLHIERNSTDVSGSVIHHAKVVNSGMNQYTFELHPNYTIDSIKVNQNLVTSSRLGNAVSASLLSAANAGDLLQVQIWYQGTAPNSGSSAIGNGLSTDVSQSWGNEVTWSLSQPYSAYEWWPCKQNLTDKADSCKVFITTDAANLAGSNGLLTQTVNVSGGKKRFEWAHNYPIDYYLISVAVAKYVDYSFYANPVGSSSPVLIQNYIYDNPQTLSNFQADIDETKDMIELLAQLLGPYPFSNEKYGHCMAPFSGGMEHQTMTTQGFFYFGLTMHELGHQWFGDHVTCATWQDIWVNEGFASYTEYLGLEYLHPTDAAQHMIDVHTSVMADPDGSVWVPDTTQVNRIFDSRLSYDKGSAIIHMIRFELNDDTVFFNVLKTYQQQFSHSNATALDFKQVLETVSGKNFTTFFNQWFYGEGYPTFTVKWFHKNGVLYLQNTQTASFPSVTPLFETPVEFRIARPAGQDTFIRLPINQASQVYSLPVSGTVTGVITDPNNWILNKSGGVSKDSNIIQLVALEGNLENKNDMVDFGMNPFGNTLEFTVLAGSAEGTIRVYDLQGKAVLESGVEKGKLYLNTSNLEAGVYQVQFTNSAGIQFSRKMIRN